MTSRFSHSIIAILFNSFIAGHVYSAAAPDFVTGDYLRNQYGCVHCLHYQNQRTFHTPPHFQTFTPVVNQFVPWWYSYSMPMYMNYNRPGAWMNYGLNGGFYPGLHGGGFAGKPNVYVYGAPGTKFSISLSFKENSELIAAVPPLRNHWKGTTAQSGVLVDNTYYDYLYYDYGVDISKLQWTKGSCVEKKKLMPHLQELLIQSGFNKTEIDDFNEFWSFKIPPAKNYCVFPHSNHELNNAVTYQVTPAATVNRILLFIIPHANDFSEELTALPYFQKPNETWTASPETSENPLYINEWGVAFLDETHFSN